MNYRKANISDLEKISNLVTDLLGTCNIKDESNQVKRNDILKDNGYCMYCVNRNKECNSCKAQLWIKNEVNLCKC